MYFFFKPINFHLDYLPKQEHFMTVYAINMCERSSKNQRSLFNQGQVVR